MNNDIYVVYGEVIGTGKETCIFKAFDNVYNAYTYAINDCNKDKEVINTFNDVQDNIRFYGSSMVYTFTNENDLTFVVYIQRVSFDKAQ